MPPEILLVDDQPANLISLESLLASREFEIVKASSGFEALRLMLQRDFALVLLDVVMPGMDGLEVARLMRQRARSEQTPIIFLTAVDAGEEHVSRGYSLGAVDYIYKPIVPEILKAKVRSFVAHFNKSRLLAGREQALRERIAAVSHELKQPIAAISISAETLRLTDTSDRKVRSRFVKIIEDHAQRLGGLVDDLLTMAELDSGDRAPRPANIPLSGFTRRVVRGFSPVAYRKKVSIEMNIPSDLRVQMDEPHLSRILQNLLDNAVKYSAAGGHVHVQALRLDDRHARLTVHDSGIGISPEELPRIFEPFHRTEAARACASGNGLGLPMIKKLVESNGGRIWAESEKGCGSTFHVQMPSPPPPRPESPSDPSLDVGGDRLRALLRRDHNPAGCRWVSASWVGS